jgi:hypothetical protein
LLIETFLSDLPNYHSFAVIFYLHFRKRVGPLLPHISYKEKEATSHLVLVLQAGENEKATQAVKTTPHIN